MLDVGTGTGILAMVAYKLGLREVVMLDHDLQCVRVANANLQINGCRHLKAIEADFKGYESKMRFDFVAANLLTEDLISFRRKLVSMVNPGKYLAISGISLTNYRRLKNEFRQLPLRCLKMIKGKSWVAILLQRLEG